ncbi:hypothetical protein O0L34_g7087 [Tuta absoluta]|nr:hypothetical protein O0L34_g7087 [Tuta absoluta]
MRRGQPAAPVAPATHATHATTATPATHATHATTATPATPAPAPQALFCAYAIVGEPLVSYDQYSQLHKHIQFRWAGEVGSSSPELFNPTAPEAYELTRSYCSLRAADY